MSEHGDYEALKERVIALESQVHTLVNQRNHNAGSFFADFFKGFFVVLGALFWTIVVYVVLNNIVSRWISDAVDVSRFQLLLLLTSLVFVATIGFTLFFFRRR
jgi:hypothetical protein